MRGGLRKKIPYLNCPAPPEFDFCSYIHVNEMGKNMKNFDTFRNKF